MPLLFYLCNQLSLAASAVKVPLLLEGRHLAATSAVDLQVYVSPGMTAMDLQVITRTASIRVAEYAFKYARDNNRTKVTAIHKVGR